MKKSVCGMLILVAVICASIMICFGQTFANSMLSEEDLQSYSLNDIMFYDPCSGGSSGGSGGACGITVSGSTMEEKVWSGLTTFMTEEQAAGVMGNMETESAHTFSPAIHEISFFTNGGFANFDVGTDSSTSYGIGLIQWSGSRRVNLHDTFVENGAAELWDKYIDKERQTYGDVKLGGDGFLKKAGDDVANRMIAIELCFLKEEIETSYKELYDKKTPEEAAYYFLVSVERPRDPAASKDAREKAAKKFYDQFHGKSITGSSSSGGSASCGGGNVKDSKNINATAVALAWPEDTPEKDYLYKQTNGKSGSVVWKNDLYSALAKDSGGPTEAFKTAFDEVFPINGNRKTWNQCSRMGASCDVFAATTVRYSGYDKGFPRGLGGVLNHARSKSDLWEVLPFEKSKLQAGDLMVRTSKGHIAIAVRDENDELWIAQGSLCSKFGYISKNDSNNYQYIIRAKKANNSTAGVSVKDGVANSNSSGTVTKAGTGNGDIGASALELAWPFGTDEDTYKSKATDKFAKYYKEINPSNDVHGGRSCDRFVSTVVKYAGVDDDIPSGNAPNIQEYLAGSDLWEEVQMKDPKSTKEYQDGDVIAFGNDGISHVGIYVEDGGKGYIAQASYDGDGNPAYYGVVKDTSNITSNYFSTVKAYRNKNNKNATVECDVCAGESDEDGGGSGSAGNLKSGGMTLAEAKEWIKPYHDAAMTKKYGYAPNGGATLPVGSILQFDGADVRTDTCGHGTLNNCVAFSQWFVNKYTTLGPNWNHTAMGNRMVSRLGEYGFATGSTPEVYAVFSQVSNHTGVVLGIDKERNKMVIGQASCGFYYEPHVKEESINQNWTYAYAGRKLRGAEP